MFCSQGPWPLQWTDFCHPTAHGPMGLGRGNCEMRTNAIYRIFLERTMGTISTRNCCWREPLCIRHTAHACGCKQGYPKNELFSWYFWKGHSWISAECILFWKKVVVVTLCFRIKQFTTQGFSWQMFLLPEAEPNTSGSQVVLLPHDFIGNRKDEDLFFCSSRIFLVFVSCVGVFFLFLNETCV